ncbi:MFS transporter [Halodesulfurarchaeum formicicum]|uniref:Nitrate/nitrite transporter n=1 Tax=Halodesulfurarchaeum formicicum TaxID=1873524 RepID=A0A1J1ACG5_9EURY|nr:MFS transporter [Halodesulfurarchaeum formicicum]APE95459.1 nitrate/nitrite transporter [Halodesulfurarchaeum formicicum]
MGLFGVPSRHNLLGPIGLLVTGWLLWLFIGAWAITPSSVLPLVMDAFAIKETAASWVITAPQIAALLAGLPVGMLLDRFNRGRSVLLSVLLLLVVGLVNTVFAARGQYFALLGSRVLGGFGLVTIWIAQTAMITQAFPAHREATAVGLFVTGYPAGYAFGQFTGPLIASVLDWTATFGVYAVVGFAFGLAFWLIDRGIDTTAAGTDSPTRSDLRRAVTNRGVWGVGLLSMLSYMIYMIFNSWMPTYLASSFEISLARSGLYTALFPAIGILARPGGGYLSERVFGGRSRPVIGISLFGAGIVAAIMGVSSTLTLMVAGLVAAGFIVQLQFGLLYTLVQRYVPRKVGGTAVSVVSAVGWLGTFVGPPIVGAVIEGTGTYIAVFGATVALSVGGLLTVVALSEPAVR